MLSNMKPVPRAIVVAGLVAGVIYAGTFIPWPKKAPEQPEQQRIEAVQQQPPTPAAPVVEPPVAHVERTPPAEPAPAVESTAGDAGLAAVLRKGQR